VRQAPEWFEEQVSRRAGQAAIRRGSREWSYAELDGMAEAIACGIVRRGVEYPALVGIFVEDRVWLAAAVLGALKARCGFVPLDAALPDERLRTMLEECEPAVLLAEASLVERLAPL